LGTYLGTIMTDASGQLNMVFGGGAAGGLAAVLGVWNAYNREDVAARVSDTTNPWSWNQANPRSVNGSNNNRVTFVTGLAVDAAHALYSSNVSLPATAGSFALWGFAMDAANVFDRSTGIQNPTANAMGAWLTASGKYKPVLGQHFIQAVEQ